MRTIKFRAWDKRLKAMIKVTHDYQLHVRDIYWEIIDLKIGCKVLDNWRDNENGNVLMQYTGLLDKNRAKIFEGDILEYDDIQQHYGKEIRKRIKGVVEYHPCYFSCGKVRLGGFSPEHFQMEIIGNIYEHSHLLSGGQQ